MSPKSSDDEEPGWLDSEQPEALVEVIDPDGATLGWMTRKDAHLLDEIPQVIETPPRYLDDPYVWYHVQLIDERDLYRGGLDLNDIQLTLLSAALIKRRRKVAADRDEDFEQEMFVNNPSLFKAYIDKKKAEREAESGPSVQQRVPGSVEEFLATIAAFSEGDDPDSGKGQERAEGWLASFLSDEDLDQMDD